MIAGVVATVVRMITSFITNSTLTFNSGEYTSGTRHWMGFHKDGTPSPTPTYVDGTVLGAEPSKARYYYDDSTSVFTFELTIRAPFVQQDFVSEVIIPGYGTLYTASADLFSNDTFVATIASDGRTKMGTSWRWNNLPAPVPSSFVAGQDVTLTFNGTGEPPPFWRGDDGLAFGNSEYTLSGKTATRSSGSGDKVLGTSPDRIAGKLYFEIEVISYQGSKDNIAMGLVYTNLSPSGTFGLGWWDYNGGTLTELEALVPGTITEGDVLCFAVDIDGGGWTVGRNGSYTTVPDGGYVAVLDNGNQQMIGCQMTDTSGSSINVRTQDDEFSYTPPAGYLAWGDNLEWGR